MRIDNRMALCIFLFLAVVFVLYQRRIADLQSQVKLLRGLSTQDVGIRQALELNAQRRIAERKAWMTEPHTEADHFSKQAADRMWWQFSPYYTCPWTMQKKPGCHELHDGGKWVCGGPEIGKGKRDPASRCIVYSVGSRGNDYFEHTVKEATDCEIHIFDPTSEPLKGYNYHSLGLADHDGEVAMQTDASFAGQKFPVKTLQSIMKGLGHTYIDILKIDVDGWECGILEKMDWTGLNIGQFQIEIHPEVEACKVSYGKGPVTAKVMNGWFTKLEAAGLRLMTLEPVTMISNSQVELAFLNKDWDPRGDWVRHLKKSK